MQLTTWTQPDIVEGRIPAFDRIRLVSWNCAGELKCTGDERIFTSAVLMIALKL
jgi:hypothetical protein